MKSLKSALRILLPLTLFYAIPTYGIEENEYSIKVEYSNIWFWDTSKTAEDTNGNFTLEWDRNGITKLSLNKADPNIRNFSFFTRSIYRKYLKGKLNSGSDLSRGELEVLRLCLFTEIATINTYSYVFAKELGIEKELNLDSYLIAPRNLDMKNSYTSDLKGKMYNMQENFINKDDDVMRYTLSNFAKRFKEAKTSAILKDIDAIRNNQRKDFWGRRWYSPANQIKIKKELVSAYDQCDIKTDNFSGNWAAICRRNDICMSNIYDIRKEMDEFISRSTNASNMNELDSMELFSRDSIDKYNRTNLILFNDFPATACANRCLSEIWDSRGFFNDNETKMKEAMTSFVRNVRGTKIPLRFVSTHSSALYTQITQAMKEELGDAEWKEFKSSLSLMNIDELDALFGIRTDNNTK